MLQRTSKLTARSLLLRIELADFLFLRRGTGVFGGNLLPPIDRNLSFKVGLYLYCWDPSIVKVDSYLTMKMICIMFAHTRTADVYLYVCCRFVHVFVFRNQLQLMPVD